MTSHRRIYSFPRTVLFGLVLAGVVATAGAHRGWSGYEADKTLTLTGEIACVPVGRSRQPMSF